MSLRTLVRPIRVRLTLWYVLLLAVVLFIFSSTLYLALRMTLYDDLGDILRSSVVLITNSLEVDAWGNLSAGPGQPLLWSNPKQGELFWRIIDRSGEIIDQAGVQDMGPVPIDSAVLGAALNGQEIIQTIHVGDTAIRVYTAPVSHAGQIVGVVQQGISLDDVLQTLAMFRWTLGLALPATLALASVGGLFLANRALRPVDQITRTAQSISAQDLSRRLNMNLADDELGRLARTFDAMIGRLDAAFRRQHRFTADASHELRTPLTIIKGDLSLALARPREADYYRQTLVELNEEVDHMSRLVERLLALARADAEGLTIRRQTVNLSDLLADLVEQTRPMAETKGLELTAQIAPDLSASVDTDAITQVVLNLLDNAIKYSSSPGRVRLSGHRSTPNDNEIQIAISDSGPGIPAEHLPHIFDRFYRVDRARSRELGGAGLGLSIARELTCAHDGELTVHSIPGEGSTFTVHLPVA